MYITLTDFRAFVQLVHVQHIFICSVRLARPCAPLLVKHALVNVTGSSTSGPVNSFAVFFAETCDDCHSSSLPRICASLKNLQTIRAKSTISRQIVHQTCMSDVESRSGLISNCGCSTAKLLQTSNVNSHHKTHSTSHRLIWMELQHRQQSCPGYCYPHRYCQHCCCHSRCSQHCCSQHSMCLHAQTDCIHKHLDRFT